MVSRLGKFALAFALLLGLWTGSAAAVSLQSIGSFTQPIYVTSAPDNPDRLFVVERRGTIIQVHNGVRSTFANISSLITTSGEGGLQSIALAPDFAQSGRLFVFYTGKEEPGEIHVAEMRASGSTAPFTSLRNLLTIPHPEEDNHYGGQLQFGPEGHLFISTGDGGGRDDEHHNAQNLGTLLGKILRIDPDPVGVLPYTIPAGNPFPGSPIWSYGLRNPFRFSFDRATGDLWIGDVGQEAREEVDFAAAPGLGAGANYGWNCREGLVAGPATDEGCGTASPDDFTDPVFEYGHSDPGDGGTYGCAIIGGYVGRGPGLGDLYGRYLYGDLCVGELRSFAPSAPFATDRSEGITIESLNSFGEDSCGRLYAVSGDGPVYRLTQEGAVAVCPVSQPPPPVLSPSFVGIRAVTRRVPRNRRAMITAWVSPCKGRQGEPITLWRRGRKLGTKRLDRVCSARFRPRINRRWAFRATVNADETYVGAISRKLTIKPKPRKKHRRGKR
jgi:glucose/arabinose dehydrogenase